MILIDEVTGDIDYPAKMTKEQALSKALGACFVNDPWRVLEAAGRWIAVIASTMREEEEKDEKHTDRPE